MLTVVLASGCTSWRTMPAEPGVVIARETPSEVRLTLRNGAVTTVRSPVVRNDSIVPAVASQEGVAVSEIGILEIRRFSAVRSLGLAAAGIAGATLWTVAATGSSGQDEGPGPLPKFTPSLLGIAQWLGGFLGGG